MWQEGFTEKEQAVAEMCSNLSVILHSVHLNVQSHYDKTERYFTFLKIRIYEFYQQSYYTTCTIFRHLKRKRKKNFINYHSCRNENFNTLQVMFCLWSRLFLRMDTTLVKSSDSVFIQERINCIINSISKLFIINNIHTELLLPEMPTLNGMI